MTKLVRQAGGWGLRVKGETLNAVLGGPEQPLDRDELFMQNHPTLLLKLHHLAGIKELRRGVNRSVPGQTRAQRQQVGAASGDVALLGRVDTWLYEWIYSREHWLRIRLEKEVAQYDNGFPPMAGDFGNRDLTSLARYGDSRLVQIYTEALPLEAQARLVETLSNLGMVAATGIEQLKRQLEQAT